MDGIRSPVSLESPVVDTEERPSDLMAGSLSF